MPDMRRLAPVALLIVLAACSVDQTTAPAAPSDAEIIPAITATAESAGEASQVALVDIGALNQPVDAASRSGDPAVYFVSRIGTIHRFADDTFESAAVLDISDLTDGDGERGLLGLAFSPDGAVAYVNYTDLAGATTIASLAVDTRGVFDRGTLQTLLTIDQPFRNHNAGDIVVEPSGTLLVSMGDGGSADDPLRVSLDDSSLLGKVLRVDPRDGAVTVLAKGLRNPWRVDLHEDRLWLADVGQNKWEEVSVLDDVSSRTASTVVDFGWSAYEANDRFNEDQVSPNHVPPVVAYEHGDNGCSVSGGAVAVAGALRGRYVFADYCSGRVWSIATDTAAPEMVLHFDNVDSPAAVVRAGDAVFVLSLSGTIWRLDG
jgi:glucose/arabinose dehydrogenase